MKADDFFEKYKISPNMEQKEAIGHVKGPALVLAGPGSGKTTVITARCAMLVNLMLDGNIRPAGVLTVAFNKTAALEMEQRYEKIFGYLKPCDKKVSFSTFHSFCNSIIKSFEKAEGINYKRLSEKEGDLCKEKILYSLYKQKNGIELTSREISKLSGEISRIKSGKISDVRVSMSNFKNVDGLFEEYEAFKFEHRYIDFDDMLYMARDILETDREIKDRVRNAYGYVQVDEGQDLSEIQLEILKLISQNVFIVGDDDQGIYGFRGAVPEVMIEIEKYFSGCAIYMLKRNYRSTENIVSSADIFIKQNENRYEKEFIAGSYKGRKPKCRMFEDDKELIAFVRSRALSEKYGNLGILYRNGASSVIPAIMCVKYNIPFKLSGKTGVFFESEITGDILEILRFNARKKKFIKKTPESVLKDYISEDYCKELRKKCESASVRFEDAIRYISAWECLVKGLDTYEEAEELFYKIKIAAQNGGNTDNGKYRLHLSTVHSAKGLEYDTVIIIDLHKGEFPKNCGEEEMSEERRLFYVAMTRAKKHLYITCVKRRLFMTLTPGEFYDFSRRFTQKFKDA